MAFTLVGSPIVATNYTVPATITLTTNNTKEKDLHIKDADRFALEMLKTSPDIACNDGNSRVIYVNRDKFIFVKDHVCPGPQKFTLHITDSKTLMEFTSVDFIFGDSILYHEKIIINGNKGGSGMNNICVIYSNMDARVNIEMRNENDFRDGFFIEVYDFTTRTKKYMTTLEVIFQSR